MHYSGDNIDMNEEQPIEQPPVESAGSEQPPAEPVRNDPPPQDPRRRLRELLAIPDPPPTQPTL